MNEHDRTLATMDADWESMRHLLPAMDAVKERFGPDIEKFTRTIFNMGWMTGNLTGYAQGMEAAFEIDEEVPAKKVEAEN